MEKSISEIGKRAFEVAKREDETIFKRPAVPKKRVLDETTYSQKLEKIIVRDFFPDLPKLGAQSEYLEALKRNDVEKMRELHIKYGPKRGKIPTPNLYNTPNSFETPESRTGESPMPTVRQGETPLAKEDEAPTHNPEPDPSKDEDLKLTLDQFLARNTSEDNASFAEIMRLNEERHRQKHAWLHEKEEEQQQREKEILTLPSIEVQAIEDTNQTKVETWKYTTRNHVMYVPDGVEKSSIEKIDDAKIQPREIHYDNTRFPKNPFNLSKSKEKIAEAANFQAQTLHGRIGPDGKEILPSQSPSVNGFGFVGTPSPAPGVDESPVMTWGEIEGTPFRLDGADTPNPKTPGPTFRMAEQPKRDRLLYELADEVGKAHRAKKKQALERVKRMATPTPKFGSASRTERIAGMSPAAKRLASTKLGIRTHSDRALRASYTPSPVRKNPLDKTPSSLTPTPTRTPKSKRGPPSARTEKQTPKKDQPSSITDDLLQLPERPNATDFF